MIIIIYSIYTVYYSVIFHRVLINYMSLILVIITIHKEILKLEDFHGHRIYKKIKISFINLFLADKCIRANNKRCLNIKYIH